MGYPDVVAYALDMAGMGAMDKDYAGLTPLHKAAFKVHHNNVRLLLKYGADPSAQVKGTRALHEGNPFVTTLYKCPCKIKLQNNTPFLSSNRMSVP